ncbi:DUF411 domain-containing protein [Cyanobacterium stanieri]|uniref:DUF411 domain-containing protein n=1 Tax=Cyanobacterium stanieri TaxID=102235 RepID=UPI0019D61634
MKTKPINSILKSIVPLGAVSAIALSLSLLTINPSAKSEPLNHTISVFRDPNCGCCQSWIKHLQKEGFTVRDFVSNNMGNIKQQYNVPEQLISCHTATVNGYTIEGHVPAEQIKKILQNKPNIAGLGVPGMPIGSPGMESGDYVQPYAVFSFTNTGKLQQFAQY